MALILMMMVACDVDGDCGDDDIDDNVRFQKIKEIEICAKSINVGKLLIILKRIYILNFFFLKNRYLCFFFPY